MAAFADLNIPWSDNKKDLRKQIETAIRLGYEVIAINNQESIFSREKKSKQEKDKIPEARSPEKILFSAFEWKSLGEDMGIKVGRLRQLSRFTAIISEPSQVIQLQKSNVIQSYDILAVQPTTEKMFQVACQSLEIDIISLNMTQRLPFFLKRSFIRLALERGVHFEICYAPVVRDQTARRLTIQNAHSLVGLTKGKNMIISSYGEKELDFRSPLDVSNLAFLFGLNMQRGKECVSSNCRSVLMHAKALKSSQGVLKLSKISELSSVDEWVAAGHSSEGLVSVERVPAASTTGKHTAEPETISSQSNVQPPVKKRKTDRENSFNPYM